MKFTPFTVSVKDGNGYTVKGFDMTAKGSYELAKELTEQGFEVLRERNEMPRPVLVAY